MISNRMILPVCMLLMCICAHSQSAQESTETDPGMEMMALMQKHTALTEHHAALAQYLGDWEVDITLMMPGMPPMESTGKATISWAIEDRWIANRVTGQMMGQAYESLSLHGFDSFAKNHVTATVSNMDNSLNVTRGVIVDPAGKVSVEYGTLHEYLTGELNKPLKSIFRHISDKEMVMEVWDLGIGEAGAMVVKFHYKRGI